MKLRLGINPNLVFIWQELMNDEARKASYLTLAFVLLGAALSIASPYGIGLMIDGVSTQGVRTLLYGVGIYFTLAFVSHVLSFIRMRKREKIFQICYVHIPMRITQLFFARPLGMLTSEDSEIDGGGVESLKDKVWNVLGSYIFSIIPNFALALFGVCACFLVNVYLGLVILLFVCIDTYVGTRINTFIQKRMKPVITGFRRWHRRTLERWNATPLIKSNGVEHRVIDDIVEEVQEPLRGDSKVWMDFFPFALTGRRIVALCFQGVVYALAIRLTWQGAISTEGFVLLFFSFERIVQVLQDISDLQRDVQYNITSIDKFREVLIKKPPYTYNVGDAFRDDHVSINLSDVYLGYGEGKKRREVLRDVSFTIEQGERVGVVGPSGAGKSQILNLILRGTDPDEGMVRINGKDIRDLSLETFTRMLGIIPQKSELFEGSIQENVVFGVSHLDQERLVHALDVEPRVWESIHRAGLDFGERLTDGLQTKIGYKGMRLSGGQQQRLMIAQAFFKQPLALIADEATSSLDSVSEAKVLEYLYESLPEETTMIMVAHRLSTFRGCKKFIFVRPIDECGENATQVTVHASLSELYGVDPLFRKMADAQGYRP